VSGGSGGVNNHSFAGRDPGMRRFMPLHFGREPTELPPSVGPKLADGAQNRRAQLPKPFTQPFRQMLRVSPSALGGLSLQLERQT